MVNASSDVVEFLAKLDMFSAMNRQNLEDIAQEADMIDLKGGEILFAEDAPADSVYFIYDGRIAIKSGGGDAEQTLIVLNPGDTIGEMSLFGREAVRSATAYSMTDSTLLKFSKKGFEAVVSKNPSIAFALIQTLSGRLRHVDSKYVTHLEEKNKALQEALVKLKAAQADLVQKERLEQEMEIARNIQHDFLPRRIAMPGGWELSVSTEPARWVGGDFYDVITLDGEGLIGVVVADVCGHGVGSALFMALSRSLLRAYSLGEGYSTSEADAKRRASLRPSRMSSSETMSFKTLEVVQAVSKVNRYISFFHDEANMFTTIFYGVLQPHDGLMTYINAGHNPPIVIKGPGRVERLHATGTVVGVLPDTSYDIRTVHLDPGDIFVGFTDGIIEAENGAREMFEEARLLEILQAPEVFELSADEVKRLVMKEVRDFSYGNEQSDDITLLILKRK